VARPSGDEVLVAIMNSWSDFAIAQEKHWYRIPVATAPKRWPPDWLAFYHTNVFGNMAHSVQYYARVRRIEVVQRRELFPHEPPNEKSDRQYYQLFLQRLKPLSEPIRSPRARRNPFICTTWAKFTSAAGINDLFDDSPLEDALWAEMKKQEIPAERQWLLTTQDGKFLLDFALFCVDGKLDVETDGDTWHANVKRAARDYPRDNAVQAAGWRILRFNSLQIGESAAAYCVPKITKMIKNLNGLTEEGLVPRQFFNVPDGTAQQLTLVEEDAGDEEIPG
jgi:very-short-patch-repair endonuclease